MKVSFLIMVLLQFSYQNLTYSQVTPPNFNFTFKTLKIFMPNSPLAPIIKKYGNGTLLEKSGSIQVLRFQIEHLRYKFPIILQVHQGLVLDFYSKLPSYFLHNIFLQSLVKRLGKQDSYFKNEEQAIYIWKNKNGIRHIYNGACTITCFPIYYSAITNSPPKEVGDYLPTIDKLLTR